jgi:hypothetical protein
MFLTPADVAELTGIRTGRGGRTREQLQADWLRAHGIAHWVNARGRPIVARTAIEGRAVDQATPPAPAPWTPKVLTLATGGRR